MSVFNNEKLPRYLAGSTIKAVGQELQVAHSPNPGWHLHNTHQLPALQAPQVKQVGAPPGGQSLPIPV